MLGALNQGIKFRLIAALKGFPMAVAWEQSQGQSTAGLTDEDLRGLQDLEKNGVPVETRHAANAGAAKAKRPRAEFRPPHGRRLYEGSRPEHYDDDYCYKCGQQGHWKYECPNPHPASGSLPQP